MQLEGEDYAALFGAIPTPYLVMTPALEVVTANDAFLATVGRALPELVGRAVFEAFPPTQDALDDSGSARLQTAFERVRDTARAEALPVQKYDIEDVDGVVSAHHWSLVAVPLLDDAGRTRLIVLRAEDVSAFVEERSRGDRAQQRVASLAEVALELTAVDTIEELEEVVVGRGLRVLGADGGAIVSRHEDGGWRLSVNTALGERVQVTYGHLPHDSPLPAIWTARTGERLVLPDKAAGLAFHPAMKQVYVDTMRDAWVFLPLRAHGEQLGSLAVSWASARAFGADDLEVLDGFAAQCAQALARLRIAQSQRAAALQVERISEALQVSLLTSPPAPPELEIAVRYLPAMQQAQVGGDWYDAFVDTSGATLVSVGDVAGHDRSAAAAMAGVRNLLRGLAVDSRDTPGVLLSRLDRALHVLELDVLATALLARLEPGHLLRWSSAGHLPPVMCGPGGEVSVLGGPADLLLGLDPTTERTEHLTAVPPGSTLVLCTDGLVERRGEHLDDGLARLAAAVGGACGRDADEVCDAVLAAMLDEEPDDDVALLVLRVRRPAE